MSTQTDLDLFARLLKYLSCETLNRVLRDLDRSDEFAAAEHDLHPFEGAIEAEIVARDRKGEK